MPTFHPSLGSTIFVRHTSTSDDDSFAHITFHAKYAADEDRSGLWQVWTNLPLLDEQGESFFSVGEWHAMTLSEPVNNKPLSENQHHRTTALELHASHSAPNDIILTAAGVIDATILRAYSFTFRRVFGNGDVHWLGYDGGNGSIEVTGDDNKIRCKRPEQVQKGMDGAGLGLNGVSVRWSTSDT